MSANEWEDSGGGEDQCVAFDSLFDIFGLNKESLKNAGTEGMLKLLLSSLYTCNNQCHRKEVRSFIKYLKNPKFEMVQQALFALILDSLSSRPQYVSTQATSKTALELLKWITTVCNGSSSLPQNFTKLLSLLVGRIQGKRLERSAENKLRVFYDSLPKEVFEKVVQDLVKLNGPIVVLSITVSYLHRSNRLNGLMGVGDFPKKASLLMILLLDVFVNNGFTTKVANPSWVLEKTCNNLVPPLVTEEVFQGILLPIIQKAMLRGPGLAIEAVGFTLGAVGFDLSPFATDLGKILGGSLHSQEELTRIQAVSASSLLIKNVSKIEGVQAIIRWYFDIFNGAEGKLSVAAHKINILRTIKLMRDSGVSTPQFDQLLTYVVRRSIKILKSEVHEGTVLEILELVVHWTEKLSGSIPAKLMTYLTKSFPNLKGNIRTAACNVIVASFIHDNRDTSMTQAFFDLLCKNYEKSSSTITQVNGLSECVALAAVILRANLPVPENLISTFWSLWAHINEKFIGSCNFWSVPHIAYLVDKLLPAAKDRVTDDMFDALACSLAVKEHATRKRVRQILFATLHSNNDISHFTALSRGLRRTFETSTVSIHIKEEILMSTALEFAKLNHNDRELLAIELIWPAHSVKNDLWIQMVQCMEVEPEILTFMSHRTDEVNEKFIDQFDGSEHMRSILKTIAFIVGEKAVRDCLERFISVVNDPEILGVTRDDYFIFLTPEGQLYDNSVIEAAKDSTKNLKRESRVYSYKEQLEEIQRRKELEEKRKKSGKHVVYTRKQKKAIKNQLVKETAVRATVAGLHSRVNIGLGLLQSAFEGNPEVFGLFMKDIINQLIGVMRSPVAAPAAVNFFIKLGSSLFKPEIRGKAVAHRSLRLISPNCDLPKEWEEDKLLPALQNTIEYLRTKSQADDCFNGAAFSYCFPMFRSAVKQFPKDTVIVQGILNIISVVAKDVQGSLKSRDSFVPRSELVDLLYTLIETNEGTVQQMAFTSMVALTKLIEASTDLLEEKELYSHIDALTSHLKICRETGLKCLLIICPLWDPSDKTLKNSVVASVYREQFDSVSDLSAIALDIWKLSGFSVDESLHGEIFRAVLHPCEDVRGPASKAIGAYLKIHASKVEQTLQDLMAAYHEYEVPTPPLLDNCGRVLQEEIDKWEGRCGAGLALREIAKAMKPEMAKTCVEWLIPTISDRTLDVHLAMFEAAVEIIIIHGTTYINEFTCTIESYLEKLGSSARDNLWTRPACMGLKRLLKRLN